MGLYEKKLVFKRLKDKGELTPETFNLEELQTLKAQLEEFYEKISALLDGKRFTLRGFFVSAYAGEVLEVLETIEILQKTTLS